MNHIRLYNSLHSFIEWVSTYFIHVHEEDVYRDKETGEYYNSRELVDEYISYLRE